MYFKTILCIEFLLVVVLTVGLFTTVWQILKGKISKLYFILVFIIAIGVPFLVVRDVVPKVQDLKYLSSHNYYTVSGTCTAVTKSGFLKELTIEQLHYQFKPWEFSPEIGAECIIKFLPNSRYVVECTN